jgi:hypothetical protein
MRRLMLPLVLIALMVLLAACGGGREEAGSAQPEAVATAAPAPAQAATTTPAPPTPEAAGEPEPTLSAADLSALEKLESFRTTLSFSSEGTDSDGNPVTDSTEMATEFVKDPPARRLTMTIISSDDENPEQPQTVEMVEKDGTVYMKADDQWISIGTESSPFGDPDMEFLMDSGVLFDDLEGLERVRPDEKVNGIDSRHYKFTDRALAGWLALTADSNAEVDGDVWIAKDGGYLTRYVLAMKVTDGTGGALAPDLARGTVTMSYELSDVNEPIVIELPEGMAGGGISLTGFDADDPFPVPEDGTVMMSSSQMTMMQTALSAEDAAAFYEEALANLGWSKNDQESMAAGGLVSLAFDKDGNRLSLILTSEGAGAGLTQIMAAVE